MADDVLRLRATVVSDQALSELRKFGNEIGLVQQRAGRGAAQAAAGFNTFGQSIKNVGRELSYLIPGLSGFGVGTAGAGLAAGALIKTFDTFAKKIIETKFVARELGLTEQAVKGFSSAAEQAGVSADEFLSSLAGFKRVTDDIKLNMGSVRGELYSLSPQLAKDLKANENNFEKQIELVWLMKEALEKTGQTAELKKLFAVLQLSEKSLRLEWEKMQAAKARQPYVSEEDKKRAEDFRLEVGKLGEAWDRFMVKAGVHILPGLTQSLEEINKTIDAINRLLVLLPKLPSPKDFGARVMPGPGVGEPGGPVKVEPGGARPWWETPWRLFQPGAPPGKQSSLDTQQQPVKAGFSLDPAIFGKIASWGIWGAAKAAAPAAQAAGMAGTATTAAAVAVAAEAATPIFMHMARNQIIKDARETGGIPKGSIGDAFGLFSGLQQWLAERQPAASFDERFGFPSEGGISMRGLDGTPAQGALDAFTQAVKRGTFEGLQEFNDLEGGFGGGGGDGGGAAAGYSIGHGRIGGRPGLGGGPGGAPTAPGAGAPGPSGPGAPGGPGSVTPGTPGSTGPASAGGRAGITAPAGTPAARQGLATVTTPSGKHFQVDSRYAENFKGFLADYEKAGGVLGPDSGTLGTRNNPSGHPIGAAIDINQIGYGIRSRNGTSLPPEVEDQLAAKWGFVSGHQWRRPDTGHFGIQSPEAARQALQRQGMQAPSATTPAGVPDYAGGTKATWFDTGGKIAGWPDPSGQREGAQASGLPSTTPGIATPGRQGLGEWFQVTMPDGRVAVVQKTDVGPGKGPQAKGIGLDINAALASQLYSGPGAFPSGKGGFQVKPLGKNLPPGMTPGIQGKRPSGATPPSEFSNLSPAYQEGIERQTQQKSGAELLADRLDAENRLDKATSPTRINGHVNVTVNSNGTKATTAVKNRGKLFQKSTIRQHRQMQPTGDAGAATQADDSGGGASEGAEL